MGKLLKNKIFYFLMWTTNIQCKVILCLSITCYYEIIIFSSLLVESIFIFPQLMFQPLSFVMSIKTRSFLH